MEVTVLTEQRKAAVDLDQRIKTTVKTFTEDFIQLCRLLDEMCSKKLYKEFGYQTFYDYCDKEIGLKPTQSKKWAKIGEGFKENGQSTVHFENLGTEKLYLLAKLDEPEREEIQQVVNVEDISVKELKAEIERLKTANKKAESNLKSLQTELDNEKKSNEELLSLRFEKERAEMQLKRTKEELEAANDKITALENKPAEIEIAIQEDTKAKETIKQLESQLSEKDFRHAHELEEQKQQYQEQIESLESQLEQARNIPAETVTIKDDKGIFKAYYSAALSSFENLLKFVADCSEKDFCIEKAEKLLEICKEKLGGIL